MPFIHITTWPVNDKDKIVKLQEDITFVVHENIGAPLDKISVVICEVQPSHWADAGVPGNHKDFLVKSRRKNYEK
ncbi:tautomerase family protein [Serratia nevei]|uniref:tautomerase family protein n=1 Tax=Serratia nevei TaxID=2703794 RepID=UPI003FA791A8